MPSNRLDVAELLAALESARIARGFQTEAEVATATKIPASTFTRMRAGRRPSADALCSLIAWLGQPLSWFTKDAGGDDA